MIQFYAIVVFWLILGIVLFGFFLSLSYYSRARTSSLLHFTSLSFFAILAVISRLLLFHPNTYFRNYGIQTIGLWIACAMASLLLLIRAFDRDAYSPFELAFTFLVVGTLSGAAILNAWEGKKISQGFYTFTPASIGGVFILALVGLYFGYVGMKSLLYLYQNKKLTTDRNKKNQFNVMIVSLGIFMPIVGGLTILASYGLFDDNITIFIDGVVNSTLIFIAFVLLFIGAAVLSKKSRIFRLLINNIKGETIYHYYFHPVDDSVFPIDNTIITASLTSISEFFQNLMESKSQINEIVFDDFYFLSKFVRPRIEEDIPAYSCILIAKDRPIFVKKVFNKFAEQFDLKYRQEIRDMIEKRLIPDDLDSLVRDIFGF